ncbi:hypothetical protein ACFOYW_11145 [Gryllotalpicola reticulitermitis]|uniref:Alpha/beta hydrolase n=1 Tax=Gryllotalpicola reticulitermitis TaxID=1184153 RepID=A0ABV8Q7F1_9MICO
MSMEVSGGSSLAVTTEALLEAERALDRAARRAGQARESAVATAAFVASDGWLASMSPASWALRAAVHELGELAVDAARLSMELRIAAEVYGGAERFALAEQRWLATMAGPRVTVPFAAAVLAASSAQAGGLALDDPRFVTALRGVADSVDLAALLAVVQAVPGRALEETPVGAVREGDASVAGIAPPPGGFGELAGRIPPAVRGEPQVRVERYLSAEGDARWVVYVAGTSDWGIVPGDEPWDDTSNVVGLAGRSAGSTRATVAALREAGWRPGEAVLPVGHSQGGIVATALAASAFAPVPMLVTFGSPTAGVAVPRRTLDVAVEHRDDPVPALGGSARLDDSRLLVRETAPKAGPRDGLASHSMPGYGLTAQAMDASTDERLVAARATLAQFTGGGQAEVTMWRGEREPRAKPAAGG